MESDESLMRRVQRNDEGAFELLYRRHEERLWKYFSKRAPHRAEDLFQECFARLLERREQWNGSPFVPWLFVMARHLLIDDYRREKVRATEELTDQVAPAATDVADWLEGLSEENQRLIKEHYLAGFSYDELAQKYQTTPVSLRQKLSRALRSLKKGEA
jgi:RNA polymerase sigma factor (sigma-70 family)